MAVFEDYQATTLTTQPTWLVQEKLIFSIHLQSKFLEYSKMQTYDTFDKLKDYKLLMSKGNYMVNTYLGMRTYFSSVQKVFYCSSSYQKDI